MDMDEQAMMDAPAEGEMEAAAAEDKPLMDEEKAAEETQADDETKNYEPHELCCCCVCNCSNEKTRNLGCCGCFPIKCGVISIGVILFALLLFLFIEVFYTILSDAIAWWYSFVTFILLVPLIIGASFYIVFYSKDQASSRGKLFVSCQFVIISYSLWAVWNTCYFQFLYKYNDVTFGTSEMGYFHYPKKVFIVWVIYLALVVDAAFAYFICVCRTYVNAMDGEQKEEEGGALSFGGKGKGGFGF